MVLRADDVNRERQHDLDDKGIAKTAREEKTRARDQKLKDQEMMKLYKEHVLGVKPVEGLVTLDSIAPAPAKAAAKPADKALEKAAEVGSFGD